MAEWEGQHVGGLAGGSVGMADDPEEKKDDIKALDAGDIALLKSYVSPRTTVHCPPVPCPPLRGVQARKLSGGAGQ